MERDLRSTEPTWPFGGQAGQGLPPPRGGGPDQGLAGQGLIGQGLPGQGISFHPGWSFLTDSEPRLQQSKP